MDRPPQHRDYVPGDEAGIAAVVRAGFETYRSFAPAGWAPPTAGWYVEDFAERLAAPGVRGRVAVAAAAVGAAADSAVAPRPVETPDRASGPSTEAEPAGQRIVAFCGWRPATTFDEAKEPIPGLAHLWLLFVDRGWWGTSVASELIGWATAGMATAEYSAARLFTPVGQSRARSFYERHGWQPSGREDVSESLNLRLLEYRIELD